MITFEDLPKPLAFVLSGGVSLGALQVGMLRATLECGIKPDFLIGSSVGAINAAYMGLGFTEAGVGQLAKIWRGLTRSDVFGHFGLARIFSIISEPSALASSDALFRLITTHLPVSFENLAIPTFVTATEYLSGETVILSKGSLPNNLLASCAIPFVFPPVLIQGRYLVDGSVSAHVPLMPASELGARTLVVFDVGYPCKLLELPRNPLDRALHVFSIMLHRQPSGVVSFLDEDCTLIYLPSPCPLSVPAYDFSQGASLIDKGYETAKSFLHQVKVKEPGVYGQPHSHIMF